MIFFEQLVSDFKGLYTGLIVKRASDQKSRDRTLLCCNPNQREFSYGTNTSIYHRAMGISGRSFCLYYYADSK